MCVTDMIYLHDKLHAYTCISQSAVIHFMAYTLFCVVLCRVSVAMADDALATAEVQRSQSEDRSNDILQPAGGSAETRDHQILQSILNDGHYNISPEDHTALESVIATLDTTSVLAISSEEDTDR